MSMISTTIFSTTIWLIATFVTKPETDETLKKYYTQVRPMGKGWVKYSGGLLSHDSLYPALINVAISVVSIIFFLVGMGEIFFGDWIAGASFLLGGTIGILAVVRKI